MNFGAQPIAQPTGSHLLDLPPDERVAAAMQMGIRNAGPPLPHSSHLKVKLTGVVLPWNELLAEQKDLVMCCDAQGNTDPSAWRATISPDAPLTEEQLALVTAAHEAVVAQGNAIANEYRHEHAVDTTPHTFPEIAQPLDEYYLSAETVQSINAAKALAAEL